MAIDTYKFFGRLKSAGFTEPQAEAVVDCFQELEPDTSQLATKEDIHDLRLATQKDVAGLKKDIDDLRLETRKDIDDLRLATQKDVAGLKEDISGLKVAISEIKTDIFKWSFPALLAQAGLIVALIKYH